MLFQLYLGLSRDKTLPVRSYSLHKFSFLVDLPVHVVTNEFFSSIFYYHEMVRNLKIVASNTYLDHLNFVSYYPVDV